MVSSSLTPDADDTWSLGTSALQWKDLYVDGTAYIDNIDHINGGAITASGDISASGNLYIEGNVTISGSILSHITSSGNISSSLTSTGSFGKVEATSFSGEGSGITGVTADWDGTRNGDAQITGSLILSGSGTPSLNVFQVEQLQQNISILQMM